MFAIDPRQQVGRYGIGAPIIGRSVDANDRRISDAVDPLRHKLLHLCQIVALGDFQRATAPSVAGLDDRERSGEIEDEIRRPKEVAELLMEPPAQLELGIIQITPVVKRRVKPWKSRSKPPSMRAVAGPARKTRSCSARNSK